jgi:hypothetical protein
MIWVRDDALGHCPVPVFLFVRKKLQLFFGKAIDIIPLIEYNIY